MKATNFIKKHGVVGLKEVIAGRKTGQIIIGNDYANVADLSGVIESHELVERLGGLQSAKDYVPDGYKSEGLKQAIADVEACQ